MDEGTRYLVGELERLLSLRPSSEREIEAWYVESQRVQQELQTRFPELVFPREVFHFLADADIRSQDADYCQHQERFIKDYVQRAREDDVVS